MARAIDADEMKNAIREWQKSSTDFRTLEEVVDGQPTIEPVKHGKWEEMRNAYGKLEGWIHAECGREVKCMEGYCPNCGARMDGDQK